MDALRLSTSLPLQVETFSEEVVEEMSAVLSVYPESEVFYQEKESKNYKADDVVVFSKTIVPSGYFPSPLHEKGSAMKASALKQQPVHDSADNTDEGFDDLRSFPFIMIKLCVCLSRQYPSQSPVLVDCQQLIKAEGNKERMATLTATLQEVCDEFKGQQVVFDLIQTCQEFADENNYALGNCAVCMAPLQDEEECHNEQECALPLECGHCFHNACLKMWIDTKEQELREFAASPPVCDDRAAHEKKLRGMCVVCPVCRTPICSARLAIVKAAVS